MDVGVVFEVELKIWYTIYICNSERVHMTMAQIYMNLIFCIEQNVSHTYGN